MNISEKSVDALLPGRLGIVVRLVSQPGARLALLDAVNRYADNLDAEPGTEAFVVSIDPDDKDVAWLVEWFSSNEAFEDHRKADAFKVLMEELPNLLSQPPGILRIDPLRMFIQKDLVPNHQHILRTCCKLLQKFLIKVSKLLLEKL
jgi:quinol monooxygenase YgiN